ncbi:ferredoxin-type protein NapF [Pantoea sp. SO10]|uniref:ferredoxin-type protein NapF n=1 Tax=Pantoea sp. SO10 TaxID=2575375 RepID=UPI0010C98449|nr:ferredoxin-type protein NapF [Pantoea sp. SO10]QCP60413.1 ferredoxin-type protein NapF [Pantoea sp. SO10]
MALSRRELFTGQRVASADGIALPWWRGEKGCDGCGTCVSACETRIIRLAVGEVPHLDFLQGECTFCAACVDACPQPLFHARETEPFPQRIRIDNRCITFLGVNCRSCQESCEQQAIRFQLMPNGIAQPETLPQHCTGCGACIAPCPVSATGLHHEP